ncbi:MAG: c-type cytochrome [Povalibacter sp.]
MKSRISLMLASAIASLTMANAMAANEFDYCLVCHGANGNGNLAIHAPKLSGVEPWYIARQLENFADGIRGTPAEDAPGHEMGPIGMRLKKEDKVDAAVQFIGSLKSQRPAATVTGNAKHGKQLYTTCASCHGAAGQGNAAVQVPALTSRTDWYLVTQLNNFKLGLRGADERDIYGAQMRAIASTLPDDKAIADVVAYINTLK